MINQPHIKISWNNFSIDLTDQNVYRSTETFTVDNLPPVLTRVGRDAREYIDTDIELGNEYFYAVASENDVGEILLSSVTSVMTDAPSSDPHWDNVVALWQLDSEGALRDEKQGLDLLTSGNVTPSVAYGTPFGPGRAIYTGNGGYFYRRDTIYRIGAQDFTLEVWFYLLSHSTSLTGLFAFNGTANSHIRHGLRTVSSNQKLAYFNSAKSTNFSITSDAPLEVGRWHHAAITRSGNTMRLFVDGVQGGEYQVTGDITNVGTYYGLMSGYARISGDNRNEVVIHSCRETIDIARYTENFTPPTEPFPNF